MNTRQQILDATRRIIHARGLARVTTKEIAREANCAEGTLYKHFEHKEDLFLSIVQQNLPPILETLHEYAPGTHTLAKNLQAHALAALNYYDKLVPLAASFFADIDLLTRFRSIMHDMQAGPFRLYERLATYIEEEQRLGRIQSEQEPLSIAALLLGPCFHYVFNHHFLGTYLLPISPEQYVEDIVRILITGLSPAT